MKTSKRSSKAQKITKEVLMSNPFLKQMVHLRAAQIRVLEASKADSTPEKTLL
jgi:hypothetical protein